MFYFILGISSVNAQESNGEIHTSLNLTIPNDDAYINTMIWIAENFSDSNDAIKLKDKDAGIIVVKAVINDTKFSTSFTMTFRFKSNGCSIDFKDWKETQYDYSYGDTSNCYTKACRKNIKKWMLQVDQLVPGLLTEISNAMNQ